MDEHSWPSCSKAISIDKFLCVSFLLSTLIGMVSKFYIRCRKYRPIVYYLEDYVLIQVIYIQYINLFLYQLLWLTQWTLVIAHWTWVICDRIIFSMWWTMSPKWQLIGKNVTSHISVTSSKFWTFFWHNPFIFKNLRPISSGFTNQPHSRSYAYPLGIVDKFIIISRCVW